MVVLVAPSIRQGARNVVGRNAFRRESAVYPMPLVEVVIDPQVDLSSVTRGFANAEEVVGASEARQRAIGRGVQTVDRSVVKKVPVVRLRHEPNGSVDQTCRVPMRTELIPSRARDRRVGAIRIRSAVKRY